MRQYARDGRPPAKDERARLSYGQAMMLAIVTWGARYDAAFA